MTVCKYLCFSVFTVLVFSAAALSQGSQPQRPRVVPSRTAESQPINQPPVNTPKRPTLTNQIIVQTAAPLVKKTGSSQPRTAPPANAAVNKNYYTPAFSQKLLTAIQARLGIPYRYGSTGPKSYDCSGLVWSVFSEAGYDYERSSARSLWQSSVPVEGDERFKFGTLVFFNGLGHIGIVVDENHFYHASSSKGVTLSTLDGYWSKRIVGYRQMQTPEVQK